MYTVHEFHYQHAVKKKAHSVWSSVADDKLIRMCDAEVQYSGKVYIELN